MTAPKPEPKDNLKVGDRVYVSGRGYSRVVFVIERLMRTRVDVRPYASASAATHRFLRRSVVKLTDAELAFTDWLRSEPASSTGDVLVGAPCHAGDGIRFRVDALWASLDDKHVEKLIEDLRRKLAWANDRPRAGSGQAAQIVPR